MPSLFYGWSPVGVVTEYLKDTIVLRDYVKTLSHHQELTLLTVLRMKKTFLWRSMLFCLEKCAAARLLRYRSLCGLTKIKTGTTSSAIKTLQQKMQEAIPIQRTTKLYCMPP
jgi:hypothetical protein